jgi:hypothetical protein
LPESTHSPQRDPLEAAYHSGRRVGLATAALALSATSYINLLGAEKSILAIVLAALAMQGADAVPVAWSRGRTAIVIAAVHLVVIVAVLALFHDKLSELIHLLRRLS